MYAFNNLSRYVPAFMDIEEKKIESFKRGLVTKLMKTMTNSRCATYNEFVSDTLMQENQNNLHATAKGRKRAAKVGASGSSQSRASMVARPQFCPPAPKFRPPQKNTQASQPQKVFHMAFTYALPKGNVGQGSSVGPRSNQPCFNCNQTGHWFKECPTRRRVGIKTRVISSKAILRHVLVTCTIQPWRIFPQENHDCWYVSCKQAPHNCFI